MMYLKSGVFLLLVGVVWGQASSDPVVDTNYGTLRGVSDQDRYNRTYDAFFGIPFAEPPIGEFRWQPPRPMESWEGTRNATEFGPHCIQIIGGAYGLMGFGTNESEDCLYLNVYVPVSVDYALTNNLPVMVFFYGGAYLLGTTEMYPGEELSTDGQVIVVTATYRVGVMGFLSTGDEALPGNYGLWDGKAALEWTRDNIRYFGGDVNRITVFGHSAGAGMTAHCSISAETNNMFQRAIFISGSATGITAFTDNPRRSAQYLADLFSCNTTDSAEIRDCLLEKDAKDLDTFGSVSILNNENRIPNFIPVIDGVFVTQDTRVSWSEGRSNHLDLMTGTCVHDGAAFALGNPLGAPPIFNFSFNDANRDNFEIHTFFLRFFGANDDPQAVYEFIYDHNPAVNSSDDETCSRAAVQIMTDFMFAAPAHHEARVHADSGGPGSTYLYQFKHRQSFLTGYPDWVDGSHMDDIYGVLSDPFMKVFRRLLLDKEDFSPADEEVGRHIRAYYSNFAYSGNPNSGPNPVPTEWPEYDSTNRQYLIESRAPTVEVETQEQLDEWDWHMYELWGFVRPPWANPPVEADDTTQMERVEIDEEVIEFDMMMSRWYLYQYVGFDQEAMDSIDAKLYSAILSRELYKEQSP